MNWLLLIGVVLLVVIFRSSSNLASAYGIAVNVSMLIDTTLAAIFFWKAAQSCRVAIVIPLLGLIFG